MRALTIHYLNNGFLAFDLADVLRLAESKVSRSTWTCKNVDCLGQLSDELHQLSESGGCVNGSELLRLASGVYQVIDGDFHGVLYDEKSPWFIVRVIDSSLYAVNTDDETILETVTKKFHDVRKSPLDAEHGI